MYALMERFYGWLQRRSEAQKQSGLSDLWGGLYFYLTGMAAVDIGQGAFILWACRIVPSVFLLMMLVAYFAKRYRSA